MSWSDTDHPSEFVDLSVSPDEPEPCPSCGRRAAITAPPWVCDVCIDEDGGDE
jgi:hypothetical protein